MKPTRICSIEGCDRPLGRNSAHGLCGLHYSHWLAVNRPRKCKVDNCDKKAGGKSSTCPTHASRWRKYKSYDAPTPRQEVCGIENCDRPFVAKNMCAMHYGWLTKRGTLEPPVLREELRARILRRVVIEDAGYITPCWRSTYRIGNNGYTTMRVGYGDDRRKASTHRVAYQEFVGPIPEGLVLDHLCRNRPCCNPDHLEPVTQLENVQRGSLCRQEPDK